MKKLVKSIYKFTGRITLHLNGGYTLITGDWGKFTEGPNIGMEVPTRIVPFELRPVGTRVILVWTTIYPLEDQNTEYQVLPVDEKIQGYVVIQEFDDGSRTEE